MQNLAVKLGGRHFRYAPLLVASTAVLFAKNLLYARLLPVAGFGALNEAVLIGATMANFGGAGLQLLANKLLPRYYAHGQADSVAELLASALGVFGLVSAAAAAAIGIALAVGLARSPAWWYAALLYSVAQYCFVLKLIDIKSDLRFVRHASLSAMRALALMVCGAAVAFATRNAIAVLVTEALATLLLAGPIGAGTDLRAVARKALSLWNRRVWVTAHLPGALRLLWLNSTMVMLLALDRWSGLLMLSEREYGILALGLLALVVFDTAQSIINVAAYPIMGRMIARGERQRAFGLATLATAVILGVSALCYLPFVWVLDFLVRNYLSAYVEAAPIAKIAVLAGVLRLADFYASFAILCDREHVLAGTFGVAVVIAVVIIAALHLYFGVQFTPLRLTLITLSVSIITFAGNAIVAFAANRSMAALRPA
jgi:hypothetical protein